MIDLLKNIDVIFEDEVVNSSESIRVATDLVRQLEMTQQRIHELQNQLIIAQNKICGELALKLRRIMPSLNIGVGREGCKIGYRSKSLILQPDVKKGIWNIRSSDSRFSHRFLSRHSSKTVINPNLDSLINSIIKHFTEHYKTLGEDITGTGVVLVEDKLGTIVDLANWYKNLDNKSTKLNSRSARKIKDE